MKAVQRSKERKLGKRKFKQHTGTLTVIAVMREIQSIDVIKFLTNNMEETREIIFQPEPK